MIGTIFSLTTEYISEQQYDANIWRYESLKKNVQQVVNIVSYSIVKESTDGSTGNVVVAGQLRGDYSNCFLEIDGIPKTLFAIQSYSSATAYDTTLTIGDCCSALNGMAKGYFRESDDTTPIYLNDAYQAMFGQTGTIPPSGRGSEVETVGLVSGYQSPRCQSYFYKGSSIALSNSIDVSSLVADNFLQASTLMRFICAMGYKLEITGLDEGLYGWYMYYLRQNPEQTVLYTGKYIDKCIKVTLTQVSTQMIPIYFDTGHSYLVSSTINDDRVVCVKCLYNASASSTPNYREAVYYLGTDGDISAYDEGLIGKTSYVTGDNLADAKTKAQEVFDKNASSHSVVFKSDYDLHIGQPVRIMLSTGALDTAISKVVISSIDKMTEYTCGSLPDSAASRIKASSWTYGKRLPAEPKKGDLVFI